MKGKFEFKARYSCHMPVHFRGNPAEVRDPLYGDVFVLSADIAAEMDALAHGRCILINSEARALP